MLSARHFYIAAFLIVAGNAITMVALDQWQQAYPPINSPERNAYDDCADENKSVMPIGRFNRWSYEDRKECLLWTRVRRR